MTTKIIEYKKEAIEESIKYSKSSDYRQEWANEALAQILEIVRAKCDPFNVEKQSDRAFVRQVMKVFPE